MITNKNKIKQIPPTQLRSEKEIISSWKGNIDKPLVSINCITYNHAPYIEDALIGFLRQETDFPIEILVHDDASTDETVKVIEKYVQHYPSIIKPIYQTENQYSKGIKPMPYNAKRSEGKYIALCEGDDYWIGPKKLEAQVNHLEKYKNISLCFTSAVVVSPSDLKFSKTVGPKSTKPTVYSTSEVMRNGGGFMPTASIIVKSDVLKSLPNWFNCAPVGDYFLQILGSVKGGALYLPMASCVYRKNSEGSWSSRQAQRNSDDLIAELNEYYFCLERLKDYSCVKQEDIEFCKSQQTVLTALKLIFQSNYKGAKFLIEKSWDLYKVVNRLQMLLYVFRSSPSVIKVIFRVIHLIRRTLNNVRDFS